MRRCRNYEKLKPPISHHNLSLAAFLAETNWLFLALLVPVAFEPHATYHFVPIKSALLHLAGTIAWTALLLGTLESRHQLLAISKNFFKSAAFFPSVALLCWLSTIGISAVFSVEPQRVYQTHGMPSWALFSKLSEAGIFFSLVFFLRERVQCDRLLRTFLVASVPVAIFAILQRYGIAYSGMVTMKSDITSFAGGPIFLGGFLVLLIPLTCWKLWTAWNVPNRSLLLPAQKKEQILTENTRFVWIYAALLILQISAFLITEKRGPLLALLGGGAFCIALFAIWKNMGLWLRRVFFFGVITLLVLLSLAALQKMNIALSSLIWLQKLASIIPIGEGTGDPFRHSLWSAMSDVVAGNHAKWGFTDGVADPHAALRFWFGYGPDTVEAVLPFYWIYLPIWPWPFIEFSAHSMVWDAFLMLGVSGVCALMLFHGSLLWCGLPPLSGNRQSSGLTYFLFSLAGAIGGGVIFASIYHGGYAALGASFGLLAGLLTSYFWQSQRTDSAPRNTQKDYFQSIHLLRLVLLCSLTGFWIDMGFVFPTGNTNAVFWILAGWLVALRRVEESPRAWQNSKHEASSFHSYWHKVFPAVACAALGAAIVHAFVQIPLAEPESSFPFLGGRPLCYALVVLLFLPSTIFAGRIFENKRGHWRLLMGYGLLGGVVFAGAKIWWLAPALPPDKAFLEGGMSATSAVFRLEWSPLLFLAIFIVSLLGTCFTAFHGCRRMKVLIPLIAVCIAWFSFAKDPIQLRAEALAKLSKYRLAPPDFRNQIFQKALILLPGNAKLWTDYAKELYGAESSSSGAFRHLHLVLQAGMRQAPNAYFSFIAGEMYAQLAHKASDPISKSIFAASACDAFLRASRYIPKNEAAWTNAAVMHKHFLSDSETSERLLSHSDAVFRYDPNQILNARAGSWGIYYADQTRIFSESSAEQEYRFRAICLLHQAVFFEARGKTNPASLDEETRQDLFFFYFRLGMLLEQEQLFLPAAISYFGAEWFRPDSITISTQEFTRRALDSAKHSSFSFRERVFLLFGYLDGQKPEVSFGDNGATR